MEKKIKLYLVPHSHIDMEWFWTVGDLEQMLPELFYDSAFRMLEEDPKMTFAQDQTCLMNMALTNAPEEQKKLVSQWIASGRMEPVGGMYVQPELQEPCGEALIRQIRQGQKWLEEHFGKRAVCAWFIDAFGQIDQLPQILKQSGFTSYVFMRDLPEGENPDVFPTEFLCEGPDGSRILTHWLKNTYVLCESGETDTLLKIANVEVTPENQQEELRKVFAAFVDPGSLQHQTGAALILWGNDLYGQNLTTEQITELLCRAAACAGVELTAEDIEICTPSRFFDAVREQEEILPVVKKDFGLPLYRQDLRATFVTRIKLKQLNRRAEQALLSLEAMAALEKKTVPEMEQWWEKVLFNQFHDTIAGSCVDEVYVAAEERYKEVLAAVQKKKQQLLGGVADGTSFCVFNPTQFARKDSVFLPTKGEYTVQDSKGRILPACYDAREGILEVAEVEIAPYAMEYLKLLPAGAAKCPPAQALENEYYRLKIDENTGDLCSIWDKTEKKELLSAPANVLIAKQEENPEMEGAFCLTGTQKTDLGIKADSLRFENTAGGVCAVCIKQFLGFTVEKRIALQKGSRRIEFVTEIKDYTGEDHLLLTGFPMNMQAPRSVFETPFSVVYDRTGFYCAQKWAGLQEGNYCSALLNKGTCGYWVDGNELSMALLRGHSNYEQYGINGRQRGIPRFFDGKSHAELAAERGCHRFEYALVCGAYSNAQMAAEALMFNAPLEGFVAANLQPMVGCIANIPEEFVVTSLSRQDGMLQLRGYSLAQQRKRFELAFADKVDAACIVDLQNHEKAIPFVLENGVVFEANPFEIVTLRVKI